jgi:RNA polymerase sigma factor FliA
METTERKLWQRLASVKRPSLRVAIRNELVELYLPLAEQVTNYFAGRVPACVSADDIYSEACRGLIQAVEAFRLNGGASPCTYMRFRISGSVRDWLRDMDNVPRLERSKLNRVQAADQSAGRTLSDDEIKQQMGFDRPVERTTVSIHKPLQAADDRNATLADRIEDLRESTGDVRDCSYLLRGLTQRSRLIVLLYYIEGRTMKAIGKELSMSESRISQLMPSILEQIRHNAVTAGFADRRAAA